MEDKKNLGIWMDHSSAHLFDLKSEKNNKNIASAFNFKTKEETLNKSESGMHNKRQQLHEAFYVQIADEILNYNHVLLFGPTNAKTELKNYLKQDLHFKDIEISTEPADKMTENEKVAFVREYFSKV